MQSQIIFFTGKAQYKKFYGIDYKFSLGNLDVTFWASPKMKVDL
jgi:hypothetical protein